LSRLLLTTFGSLGDLHPYIAIAIEWKKRGHHATIASSEVYRTRVESEGLDFVPIRPNLAEETVRGPLMHRVMDMKSGPEYLIRGLMLPSLRETFADIDLACDGVDAIVGHPLLFAVPLVARKRNIPWVYTILAPTVFMSAHDPPVLAPVEWLGSLRRLGPRFHSVLFSLVRKRLNPWFGDVRELSRDLGMYPCQREPLGRDQFSPDLNLALFSSAFAAPKPDWPQQTVLAGFAFYDRQTTNTGLSADLEDFLSRGEPPIVFTLGSAAVMAAGEFYEQSLKASQLLGTRAVLLVGGDKANWPKSAIPHSAHVAEYASYSTLFPRCVAVVHQGGIGTTAQAMRAGKPMLIMPYAFDQPDNAYRVARKGLGRVIKRNRYSAATAAAELRTLLNGEYGARSATMGRVVSMENGQQAACCAIEEMLAGLVLGRTK
jgi:rhamnosyltransferase subunit B